MDAARGIAIVTAVTIHMAEYIGEWLYYPVLIGLTFWALSLFCFSSGVLFSGKRGIVRQFQNLFWTLLFPFFSINLFCMGYLIHFRGALCDMGSRGEKLKIILLNLIFPVKEPDMFESIFGVPFWGISPSYFFVIFVVAILIFQLLYKVPHKGVIIFSCALLANISQYYMILPFGMQDALIACLFIYLGYRYKTKFFQFADFLEQKGWIVSALATVGLLLLHIAAILVMMTAFPTLKYNFYVNRLDLLYIPAVLIGIFGGVACGILLMKVLYLGKFFAFYGKESALIIFIHSIDGMILNEWGEFRTINWFFSLLLYPAIAWCYRKASDLVKGKIRRKTA